MKDALASVEIRATDMTATGSIQGALISGATTAVGAGEIGSAEIATGGIATANIADSAVTEIKQYFVGGGSPPAAGWNIQAGGDILSSSTKWVSFPKAFNSNPYVIATPVGLVAENFVEVQSIMTASVQITGSPAAGSFNWIAIGSGGW